MSGIQQNTQGFVVVDGKVVGVDLSILGVAAARYYLRDLRLVDEVESQGNHVAKVWVMSRLGHMLHNIPVTLAWPFNGTIVMTDGVAHDANYFGKDHVEHVISNSYHPPARGPLAIHVGLPGAPQSPVVGGLGLPGGEHVSFEIVFQELDNQPPPQPPVEDVAARVADRLDACKRDVMAILLNRAVG